MDKLTLTNLTEDDIRTMIREEVRTVLEHPLPAKQAPAKDLMSVREAAEFLNLTIHNLWDGQ